MKLPLLLVCWYDHYEPNETAWTNEEYEDHDLATCQTVGWLVRATKTAIYVVPHQAVVAEDISWSSPMIIAIGAIKWVKYLDDTTISSLPKEKFEKK